ncbi:hypothetical protein ACIQC9_04115 [Brevundimonas sp. NPDC092305]|uniref:hypothetical protein n=1 Tax=Brevundimonas sp. NPDC092305 TaxID=3363957 RepID=UPI00382D2627
MSDVTRDQLVREARSVPRDVFGVASVAGLLLAVAGLVLLLASVPGFSGASRPDWRLALLILVAGAALMGWAGAVVQRRFSTAAKAAGFSPAQIREIEDEAERLNEEED